MLLPISPAPAPGSLPQDPESQATRDGVAGEGDREEMGACIPACRRTSSRPVPSRLQRWSLHGDAVGSVGRGRVPCSPLAPGPSEDRTPSELRSRVNKGCVFYSQIKAVARYYLHICTKVWTTIRKQNP